MILPDKAFLTAAVGHGAVILHEAYKSADTAGGLVISQRYIHIAGDTAGYGALVNQTGKSAHIARADRRRSAARACASDSGEKADGSRCLFKRVSGKSGGAFGIRRN